MADERFSKFTMNALIRGGPYFDLRTRDLLNFGLIEPKEIEVLDDNGVVTRYLLPVTGGDTDTDGASIPFAASVISHLIGLGIDRYGDYAPGAIVHDFIFRRKLMQWVNGVWTKLTIVESNPDVSKGEMDFARANEIFKALMFSLGTDDTRSMVVYQALSAFGKSVWDADGKIAA